ncbi:MAG: hypothetical protein WC026_11165 [Hyphomicrobium sp.]|uniref:hypothetical protein n=1 Tax=Hyphomicrobium sp. TaxID=82 RepID=UPI003562C392
MVEEGKPFKRTQLLASVLETATRWWGILLPLLGGAMSGYLAYVTSALAAYAPFSWLAAGLTAALVFILIGLGAAKTAELTARWHYTRRITANPPPVNPLDNVFTRRQIKLADIRNPFNAVHSNKTFLDCELIGPGTLLFAGNTTLDGIGFINCDCVSVRENVPVHNLIVLQDAVIRGGKIYGMTLLFPETMVEQLNREIPGIQWITRV